MTRADVIKSITYYLTLLRMQVEHLNSLNLQDINVHAENFFRDLLSLALGYNLVNINIVKRNATAIDLGDKAERIAIQVTSTSALSKIRHTHDGFVNNGMGTQYDRLVVLIIGVKANYKETSLGGNGVFEMSLKDDVWDIPDLLRQIGNLGLPELQKCLAFLRSELRIPEPHVSNEVRTLIKLIEVLSVVEDSVSLGDKLEDPDPDGKIRLRFASHAEFLKDLYVDLYAIYGRTLVEVKQHSDLGLVRLRKLQVFLMHWSDRILEQCGGDPKEALDVLVAEVLRMMGSSEVGFDDGAVRYYLTEQLIACNVFPNKLKTDA